ncbi:hypothetical protein GAYE_SCF23G4306 [Galdieria yellowstonensis]|uniref:Kinesin motor domain-containing protein n=1 Tax=Galdieria yellowstonensis TaxID=3028027 RepID=A0AAV9IG13_9RHOD|nr:hypothetical protein GAYE_SCF23G4306 [Galdieria yellowstonensis]
MQVLPSMEKDTRNSSSPLNIENTNTSKTDTLKVYVRVRPLNLREREALRTSNLSWQINGNQITQCHAGKPLSYCSYAFDRIFTPEDNNKIVFEEAACSVVNSVVDGYNGTIFAYGQTSSGKTHTMLGTADDKGIIPLSIYQVFDSLKSIEEREFLLRVSYIEIYNENIRDLLAPQNDNLKVHEDFNGRVFVDAKEEVVDCPETVLEIMKKGENNRTIGSTNMNERSSRSHTIFTVFIESREKNRDIESDGLSVRASTLTLVDLAGSERVSQTGAEGSRLKEGMHINKSLLTLGTVINKLCEGANSHIPYRDSKLTRILQPALSGNSKTTVICAITPAAMHIEETHSTLKFASRAKKVKINAHCNEILDDKAILSNYRKEIEFLRHQLTELQQDRQSGERLVSNESNQNELEESVHSETTGSEIDASSVRKRVSDGCISTERFSKLRKLSTYHCCISTGFPCKKSIVSCVQMSIDTNDDLENYVSSLKQNLEEEESKRYCLEQQLFQVSDSFGLLEKDYISCKNRYDELYSQFCFQASQTVVTDVLNKVVENELESNTKVRNESLEQSIVSQEQKFLQLQEQKEELENRVRNLESELAKRTSQLETYQTAVLPNGSQFILKENDSLKQKIGELESKCRSSKVLCSQATSEKQQLDRELRNLQKQLRKLEAENVKLKESYGKQKENSSQVNLLETKVENLMKDREKTLQELHTAENERNNFMLENKELMTKLEEARGEIENLHKELDQTKEEVSQLNTQNETFQQENNQMRQQILSLDENLRDLSASKENLAHVSKELEEKLRALETCYNDLQKRHEEEKKQMEEEQNSCYEQLTEAHLQLEQSKSSIEQLQASLSEETQKSQRYYEELEEYKETYIKDTESWKEQLQEKERQLERTSVMNTELIAKLEVVEKERDQFERDLNECSHTILVLKERLELLWKEKQQLSLELDSAREELLHSCKSPTVAPSLSLCVRSRDIFSLQPFEGEGNTSVWKQELDRTNQELSKFYREKRKLLETIHQRDLKVEQLENSYRSLLDDNGLVGKLKHKLERRDAELKRVNEELRKLEELAAAACKGTSFEDGRQLVRLQADNYALQEQVANLSKQVESLQHEREQLLEESSRLRKEIKKRDIHRLELEEKFCLWKQQLCQDDQNCRAKKKPPRPPLRSISNETQ